MDDEDGSCMVTFKRDFPAGCGVLSGNSNIVRNFKRDFPPGCGPNAIINPSSLIPWATSRNSGSSTALPVKDRVGPAVGEASRGDSNVRKLTSSNVRQTDVGPGVGRVSRTIAQNPPKVRLVYPMMNTDPKAKGARPVLEGRTSEGGSKEREYQGSGSGTALAVKNRVGSAFGEASRGGSNVLNLTSSNVKQTGLGPGVGEVSRMMGQKPPKVKLIDPMMNSEPKAKEARPVLEGRTSEGGSKEREYVLEMLKSFRKRCDVLLKEGQVRRVDIEAYKELINSGKAVKFSGLNFGDIPGVEVGDKFYYRVELTLVGLHRLFQGGIDSIEDGGVRYATCIVSNDRHLDRMSGPNMLTYVGEGGTLKKGETGIPRDQQLVAGNRALDNSRKKKKPVRVVRGLAYGTGNAKVMYVYDGLYEVVDAPKKRGPQGNMIYEFQLARIPGQPAVPWGEYRRMLI